MSRQHKPGAQGFGVLQTPRAAQKRPGHILPAGIVSPSRGIVSAGEGQSARTGLAPAPCSGVDALRGAELDGGSGAGLGTPLLPTGAELAVTEQFNKNTRYCRGLDCSHHNATAVRGRVGAQRDRGSRVALTQAKPNINPAMGVWGSPNLAGGWNTPCRVSGGQKGSSRGGGLRPYRGKKIWNASRICVSSLRRGHANLLCIVPILVYVLPKRARIHSFTRRYLKPKDSDSECSGRLG